MGHEKYIQKIEISAHTEFEFCKEVILTQVGRQAIESALCGFKVKWLEDSDIWALIEKDEYYDVHIGDMYLEDYDDLPTEVFELVDKILSYSENNDPQLQLQGIIDDSNFKIHEFTFDCCYLNNQDLVIVETTHKAYLMFRSSAESILQYSGLYMEFESVELARQYVFTKYDPLNENDFHVLSTLYQEIETDQINKLLG
ncbi:hypothetical protein [Photobacterium sp. GB-72]|uniref:hypothetical protein n=1 Tax=Photobacterium sp. GB-72 TaxID=2022105 RepID=UPI000D17AC77|nr:hypothetical protein [Photobacterium sp. GB-72]PSV27652.1 hypothetical protein C9J40_20160 [Photobacterium sp. GB-72]